MKILCFTLLFALFIGFSTLYAQDPDTVWTHDISQYKDRSFCARFMPDGKSIIAGVGNSLFEFEVSSGKLLRKFNSDTLTTDVELLEISPLGDKIITKTNFGKLYLWSYNNGKVLKQLQYHDSIDHVTNFKFIPETESLFICSIDNLLIYNLLSDKIEKRIYFESGWVNNIAVSKNGNFFAVDNQYISPYATSWPSRLQIWDVKNLKIIKQLDEISRDVRSILFSPTSKYVAFTTMQDEDCFLRIYNLQDNTKELYPSGFFGFQPWGVLFSPDEKKILVSGASDGISKLMLLDSGKIIYNIKHATGQSCLDVDANNQILFDEISKISLVNSNWYITNVLDNQSCMNNINISLKFNLNHIYINNIDNEIIKYVNIFDINGKLIKTYEAGYSGSKIELPFSAASGVYLARIVTAENDYGFRFVVSN